MARIAERVLPSLRARAVRWLAGPELDARVRALVQAELRSAAAEQHVRALARRSRIEDHVVFGDPGRLRLGAHTIVNDALFNTTSGSITVGDGAFFGHGVALLTGTHDLARRGIARQQAVPREGRDIVVGAGAWISSNATVLGPCRIGAHAVVAAGAVVRADVPEGAIVAGVPARRVGAVPPDPGGRAGKPIEPTG